MQLCLSEQTETSSEFHGQLFRAIVSLSRLKVVLTVAALGRTRSEFNRRCADETSEKIQADGNLSYADGLGSSLAMVSMLHLDG